MTTVVGFPRIGEQRELKFATEKYFKGELDQDELARTGKELRQRDWGYLQKAGIDEIPSNDFSYYDQVLDAAFLFDLVPAAVKALPLSALDK